MIIREEGILIANPSREFSALFCYFKRDSIRWNFSGRNCVKINCSRLIGINGIFRATLYRRNKICLRVRCKLQGHDRVRKSGNSGDSASVLIDKNPVRALRIFSWYQNRTRRKIVGCVWRKSLESKATLQAPLLHFARAFIAVWILSQIFGERKVGEIRKNRFATQPCEQDVVHKLAQCIYFERSLIIIFRDGAHGEIISFYTTRCATPPHFRYITHRREVIFSNTPYIFRLTVEHE